MGKRLIKYLVFTFLLFVFIFCGISAQIKEESKVVSIAMATDNNYTLPAVVAITSILENANSDTFYSFNVLVSGDFSGENKEKILSTGRKYKNAEITLIDMKNAFKSAFTSRHITTATYYRLLLPSILSDIDKVLYLDVDIIVEKDLWELFNTNIEDYYIAGVKAPTVQGRGINHAHLIGLSSISEYINAGVTLMNLKKMREDRLEEAFASLAATKKFPFHDQDIINVACFGKIYHLPFKYNMMISYDIFSDTLYYSQKKFSDCFSKTVWDEGRKDPTIMHYQTRTKPWNKGATRLKDRWWKYAKKSIFFDEIESKYSI